MTLTLETISQFLSTRFPALVLTLLVAAFIWFAEATNSRLNRIEYRTIPDEQTRIYNLELERVRQEVMQRQLEAADRQLEKERDEMRADIKKINEDIAEIKADIKVIMSKLK